jgi:hypothetical protein
LRHRESKIGAYQKQLLQPKVMQVNLLLRVENNSKFVRGKNKSREEIEEWVLSRYWTEKPYQISREGAQAIQDYLTQERPLDAARWPSPALFLTAATVPQGNGRLMVGVVNTVWNADPVRESGEHHLALQQIIFVTIADVARHLGIEVESVRALRVDHTAARLCACHRLDGDPYLRLLWQIRQRNEGLQDAAFIDGVNRHAHPFLLLLR